MRSVLTHTSSLESHFPYWPLDGKLMSYNFSIRPSMLFCVKAIRMSSNVSGNAGPIDVKPLGGALRDPCTFMSGVAKGELSPRPNSEVRTRAVEKTMMKRACTICEARGGLSKLTQHHQHGWPFMRRSASLFEVSACYDDRRREALQS